MSKVLTFSHSWINHSLINELKIVGSAAINSDPSNVSEEQAKEAEKFEKVVKNFQGQKDWPALLNEPSLRFQPSCILDRDQI